MLAKGLRGDGLDDLPGVGDLELAGHVALGSGEVGGLAEVVGGAGEGAEGEEVYFARRPSWPRWSRGGSAMRMSSRANQQESNKAAG